MSPWTQIPFNTKLEYSLINPKCLGGIVIPILEIAHINLLVSLKAFVAQLYPTLCNPMNCSSPVFSVHEISQARILEWVAIPFSRPNPGIEPGSPTLQADSLRSEPPGRPLVSLCYISSINPVHSLRSSVGRS